MPGLFDDLLPENENAGGGLFDDLLPPEEASTPMQDAAFSQTKSDLSNATQKGANDMSGEEIKSVITGNQKSEAFSDIFRNPLGTAADAIFPSLEQKRQDLQMRPEMAGGQPTGGMVLNPEETQDMFSPGGPGQYTPDIAGGVYNTARSIGELGANVSDTVGLTDQATQTYNENVPRYNADSTGGEIVSQGAGMLVPAMAGGKAAMAATKAAPAVLRWIAGLGGAAAGTGLTDTRQDGLFVGSDSLSGSTMTSGGGEYLTRGNEALARRGDIMVDSLITDAGVGAVAAGAMGLKGAIKGIFKDRIARLFSQDFRDKEIVNEVMGNFLSLPENASKEEIRAATNSLLDVAEKSKDLSTALRGKLTPEEFDALPENVKQSLSTSPDVMSVFENVFNAQKAEAKGAMEIAQGVGDATQAGKFQSQMADAEKNIAQARSMRRGVEAQPGGAPLTKLGAEKPIAAAEEMLEGGLQRTGGTEAAERTGRTLQERAIEQANVYKPEVQATKSALEGVEKDMVDAVKNDPVFGEALTQMGKDVNLDTRALRDKTDDEIRESVTSIIRTKQKELSDVMSEASKSGATIDPKKLTEASKGMKLSELSDDLRKAFGHDASFEKLYPRVPEIAAEIKRLDRQPGADAHNARVALIRIKDLVQNPDGTPEAKALVKKSLDFYENKWARYFDDGPMGAFYDSFKKNRRALGKGEKSYPSTPLEGAKGTGFKQQTDSAIEAGMRDRHGVEQTRELLAEGGKEKLIGKRYASDVLSDAQFQINSGKFEPENVADLITGLSKDNPVVKGAPEIQKSMTELAQKIRDGKADKELLQEQLSELNKRVKEKQTEIYGNKFKEFFGKTPEGKIGAQPNTQSSFRKLFVTGEGQNKDRIKTLKSEIAATGDDEVQKGFEAAYMNTVKEELIKTGTSDTGQKKIAQELGTKSNQKLIDYADDVFSNPDEATAFKEVIKQAQEAVSRRSLDVVDVAGLKSIKPDLKNAVALITQHIWGPLSKTGGKINRTTGTAIELVNPEDMAKRVDTLFSNWDDFYKVAKKLSTPRKGGISSDLGALDAQDRFLLWTLQGQAGLHALPEGVKGAADGLHDWMQSEPDTTDDQTSKILNGEGGDKDSNEPSRKKPLEITVHPDDEEEDEE